MSLYSDETLAALKERMPDYLNNVCGITNPRRPFHCLTPTHEDKDPSMHYHAPSNTVKCFSCDAHGDVFDVAGWVEGAKDFPAKVEAVAHAVNFPLEPTAQPRRRRRYRTPAIAAPKPLVQVDFIDSMQQAMWTLLEEPEGRRALEYLHGRGFDDQLLADSFVGWVQHPSEFYPGMKAPASNDGYMVLGFPELTAIEAVELEGFPKPFHVRIPYAVFRRPVPDAHPKEFKPPRITAPIWREHLLTGSYRLDEEVYVTEGIFDAMSLATLIDASTCALCGESGVGRLLQVVRQVPREALPQIVLALDSDEAGDRMTEKLSNGLMELGIAHAIKPPYPKGCKDANEYLMLVRGCHE